MGCLHSFRTDNALKKHERLCGNNDYCHVEMPTENNNTLKYNHGEKSLKVPFTIYADLECLLIKQHQNKKNHVKIILIILILKEKLCMNLVATH